MSFNPYVQGASGSSGAQNNKFDDSLLQPGTMQSGDDDDAMDVNTGAPAAAAANPNP